MFAASEYTEALNNGTIISPLSMAGTSGPGNSYFPMTPASMCSMAYITAVAWVESIFTATFLLSPLLMWVMPIAGPTLPSTWLWITIQPGPWLKTSATMTVVPSNSWSLTVTAAFLGAAVTSRTGCVGTFSLPLDAFANELQALKAIMKG